MCAVIDYKFSSKEKKSMKIKASVKAGRITANHNQTVARALKLKIGVRAGEDDTLIIKGSGR